jgi:hypothetical protein
VRVLFEDETRRLLRETVEGIESKIIGSHGQTLVELALPGYLDDAALKTNSSRSLGTGTILLGSVGHQRTVTESVTKQAQPRALCRTRTHRY